MYACFKGIPKKIRQQAFDLYAAAAKRDGQRLDLTRATLEPDKYSGGNGWGANYWWMRMNITYHCCPWGAVNYVLLKQRPNTASVAKARGYKLRLPQDGRNEGDILQLFGLNVDNTTRDAIERFIQANDNRKFMTLGQLATAMGVTYKEEQ